MKKVATSPTLKDNFQKVKEKKVRAFLTTTDGKKIELDLKKEDLQDEQ